VYYTRYLVATTQLLYNREVDDENDAYLDKVTQDVDINPVESEVDG